MLPSCFLNFDVLDFATPELLQCLFLASFRPVDARYNLEGYASMMPSLSRPAVRHSFLWFFVSLERYPTTTHLLGFGA